MTAVDWRAEAERLGLPVDAWERGRRSAAGGHIASIGADDHIIASTPGPPWVEPRWPGRVDARTVTLHGGAYDGCLLGLHALGSTLVVNGEHGRGAYEYKEHDDTSASYTAVEDEAPPADPGTLFG